MKNFLKNRILPLFLTVTIICSFCVTSVSAKEMSAGEISDFLGIIGTVADWLGALGRHWNKTNPEDYGEWYTSTYRVSGLISQNKYVNYEKSTLSDLALAWNTEFSKNATPYDWRARAEVGTVNIGAYGEDEYVDVVMLRPVYSGNMFDNPQPVCLTHVDGSLICHFQDEGSGFTDPPKWVSRNQWANSMFEMVSREKLANLARDSSGYVVNNGDFDVITNVGATKYLATSVGYIYAAYHDDNTTVTNQDRPTTSVKDENGNNVDVSGAVNLDTLNGLLTMFGDVYNIDQLLYDEGTKTYYIDASTTNNITNNYHFKWEYHIDYTSITYIGQTEEYDKYYEVYYELPDGRDSADLTKEELEQLNVAMDVIPYGRSTEYTSLRSLYHFDGDTRDASYWNYCTSFDWTSGASLTYMDAGVFNGALYLDEGDHKFSVTLPSPIYTDNFTIQFRYYQSATPAPVTDTFLRFTSREGGGGRSDWLLALDGGSMYDMNGDALSRIPTGTWNEIAITRYRYAMYYYLNGVCVGEVIDRSSYGPKLHFYFGDQQQTYKYFDELRILNHALSDGGDDYTPTSVPHDTNLSLVLPTDAVPLADEYWDFNAEGNLFEFYDYSVYSNNEDWLVDTGLINIGDNQDKWHRKSDSLVTAVCQDGYVTIANGSDVSTWSYLTTADNFNIITFPLYTYGINGTLGRQGTANYSFVQGGTYTYSFMTADGQLYSYTFTTPESQPTKGYVGNKVQLGNGAYVAMTVFSASSTSKAGGVALTLSPPANGQLDIVYMELVEGTEPNTGHEWVESVTVIDKEDINKATLAVRTDIPITKYYIGGVRPSVPHKGYVWALVENQRIKSLQIYNGQAWEAVDGRIWTGERWVPYSSYNVVTMQDLFDVHGTTDDFEYIYTENGFWDWWQRSWNEFTAKFFNVMGNGTGTNDPSKLPTDETENPESSGQNFTHFIAVLRDGFWSICVGLANAVYGGFEGFTDSVSTVGSFFTAYGDGEESIWLLPLEEGVSVWD